MQIPKKRKEYPKNINICKRKGCYKHAIYDEYCNDPKCIASRDINNDLHNSKKHNKHKNNNIIIKTKKHLACKKIKIQCSAKNSKGRCKNIMTINYHTNVTTYPKYCELHANEYRRQLFEKQ